ncbi:MULTISPECIES: NADP-dependent oxidoreductase [unclassified Rhizobium]|uniref:NADP-dependent oxidoreductase n=1 Tax=unclassified Rhizobium TaxID=2613769 RepID=UPI00116016E1|nr:MULTISPECIES: NADP-dependent oxidoreductase [unclassified Rhizobium]TQX82849.1 NADP-dependent oxidoreductase [Rhizobium sp. rho-13.1]TQY07023.1 NADP-dependent oxidoreductase [Rhizobium sp. rho-1.1]
MTTIQRVVLASRPKGAPTSENFRLESTELADAAEGEVTLKVLYLSLDPYMRGRMSDAKSYAAPTPVNGTMEGETVCEVARSRHADFKPGDIVRSRTGWCTGAVMKADAIRHVDTKGAPISTAIGVLGMPGFTAYSGMKVIGRPKEGETVVVAAASGPVGSMVGQLAKLAGARAVGIVGGQQKLDYVRDELGFDAVVDHCSKDFKTDLELACPKGIDVYFENVGGPVWEAVMPLLNMYARVPVCGLVANYNGAAASEQDNVPAMMSAILRRSLLIRGFIQTEFVVEHYAAFEAEIGPMVNSGRIKYREDVVEGLENAPEALIGMLQGKNFGKLLVKVADRSSKG